MSMTMASLDGSFIGQASVYPMQLGLKLSPFSDQLPLELPSLS